MKFLDRLILRLAEGVILRQVPKGVDLDTARALVRREIDLIAGTVHGAITWHRSEVDLLADRLSRRYDPGLALQEATNRAIEAKKAAKAAGNALTTKQEAALELQKITARRRINDA